MYRLTTFQILATTTTLTLPTARPRHYVGAGKADTAQFFPLAGGGLLDGLSQNEPAVTQGVPIPVRGAIHRGSQTAAQLETQYRALRQAVGTRGKLTRVWNSSGNSEWCYARLLALDAVEEVMNQTYLELDMLIQMFSPCWYGTANSDNFTLSAGSGNSNTLTVNNGGNAPIDNAVITITCGSTTITGVEIKHMLGATIWNHLTWSGSLTAAQTLEFDAGAHTVEKQGADDYPAFDFGASHKEAVMFRLWAGDNTVVVILTGGGTNAVVNFAFNDGHL